MLPASPSQDWPGPRWRYQVALCRSTAASRHGENSPPVPSLNSPPVDSAEDAPLSKLPFDELAPPFWLVVRAVALLGPVAGVSKENSSVCAAWCGAGLRRVLGSGA